MKPELSELDRRLLNDFQQDFPLSVTPYADMARNLGVTEEQVLARLHELKQAGAISRVGAVIRPNTVGVSTLAAMAVPPEALDAVAAIVSGYAEVNHNYEREHRLNLWFVAQAPDSTRLTEVLEEIAGRTGHEVLSFPLIEDYHIDLGFEMRWN
ncbi:MAG: Lrp/AsnC family transcriptional regulator [Gammaproteobacteria bacterium]|nr:Lrp/AsnC family transcriptional regulator [Gammaproteobacteria bacterium]MDH3370921.1 Lrp/AsnC family transcriptional regulator [Gammaproteobacteria bacterium]MDH3407451.1 Lrp/AsnC family transcriptional regulator [Gammaproteobacteria bacterium]MDH3562322.1 Lrp/AsnC family transcriptional regulator [Gammaproteobacteria bacterium]MDH5487477.1 Lrp/AsnC family transcriptional regulator [Gammaproteobacteria bacterium]